MVRYAYDQPIAVVMINTNGIRLARDPRLAEALAPMRDRLEIYLQFDGLEDGTYRTLRGEDLLQTKLAALEALRRHDLRCTLVCTVDHRTNLHELGHFRLQLDVISTRAMQEPPGAKKAEEPGDRAGK